jgi:Asp-tRNA(Asn)/Glu-tRNA(Gln) amidotransferase B subunit
MRENVVEQGVAFTSITTEGDMRSLIQLSAMFLICFVGIGFYLGWFSLSRPNPDTDGNRANVNVSVDKAKMKSDIKKAEGKVEEEIKELESRRQAKKTAQ